MSLFGYVLVKRSDLEMLLNQTRAINKKCDELQHKFGVAEGQKTHPWRNAKTDPPKESIDCIFLTWGNKMVFGYYNAEEKRFEVPNDNSFDGWPIPVSGVTHWMPKPELPKTE